MELLFYDVECLQYDSLIVFKRIDKSIYKYWWYSDNPEQASVELLELVKNFVLVGYNNYYYDDKMLSAMLYNESQKQLYIHNDNLINDDGDTTIKLSHFINSLDAMQQIDVSRPSLKQIEGNLGLSILETPIPFDIERPLSKDERETLLKYCAYDIDATIEVYKIREKGYFKTKSELLKICDNTNAARWNTTTITASLLLGNKTNIPRWSSMRIPSEYWRTSNIPIGVWGMWNHANKEDIPQSRSYTLDRFGCEIVFGFGGVHGAPNNPIECNNVKLLDVSSMYPSIIILLNALGDATSKYNDIRKERLFIKHLDPIKSNALKLVLNSTYGLFKNKYSVLYNPKASSTVCIFGQIAIFDLCERLDKLGYKIININTDGVAFYDPHGIELRLGDLYTEAWSEWEDKFGLTLELSTFDSWIQKDVNNYLAIKDGNIKAKGGDINKALEDKVFRNNDARIIHMCIVYTLLHRNDNDWSDVRLLDYLYNHIDQPKLFQYILKAGGTFKCVVDAQGNRMQKVNRVFAVKSDCPNQTKLMKLRTDNGLVNFPDAPDHMLVWNNDVSEIPNFSNIIDINHYYQIIKEKLERW